MAKNTEPIYNKIRDLFNELSEKEQVTIMSELYWDLSDYYKDKFLEPSVFQWECKANISNSELNKLKTSKDTHLFIRKVESENGITLPFTYVGKGHLQNPRKTEGANGTYLFDIHMENELPDYLQYDYGVNS